MYATVVWNVSPSSINSQKIKDRLQQILRASTSAFLWANAAIVDVANDEALRKTGDDLEQLHISFPTEFDYLCVGSAAGSRLAPLSRPTWDMPTVQRIIT